MMEECERTLPGRAHEPTGKGSLGAFGATDQVQLIDPSGAKLPRGPGTAERSTDTFAVRIPDRLLRIKTVTIV